MTRRAIIRKSDLTPALEAAKAAGWPHATVTIEVPDGRRLQIIVGDSPEAAQAELTPLEKWKADHAP